MTVRINTLGTTTLATRIAGIDDEHLLWFSLTFGACSTACSWALLWWVLVTSERIIKTIKREPRRRNDKIWGNTRRKEGHEQWNILPWVFLFIFFLFLCGVVGYWALSIVDIHDMIITCMENRSGLGQAQARLSRSTGRSRRFQNGLLSVRVGGRQPLNALNEGGVHVKEKGEHLVNFYTTHSQVWLS